MKRLLALCAALLIVSPTYAFAHEEIVQTFPAVDSKVIAAPVEVSIEFDGKLQIIGSANINLITVTDNKGQIISSPTSAVEGTKISTRLQLTDITGLVSVHYRIVSEDGHPVEGDYSFTVGETPLVMSAGNQEGDEAATRSGEGSSGLSLAGVLMAATLAVSALIVFKKRAKK